MAKFFFSCSDTELWMFFVLAALPDILENKRDRNNNKQYNKRKTEREKKKQIIRVERKISFVIYQGC